MPSPEVSYIDGNISSIAEKAKSGDMAAARKLYDYYSTHNNYQEVGDWLRFLAENGDAWASIQYSYFCINGYLSCSKVLSEGYLLSVIAEGQDQPLVIEAHILLGDLYIEIDPHKGLGYYLYAAAKNDIHAVAKLLEYYEREKHFSYEELYWLYKRKSFYEDGVYKRLLQERIDVLEQEIRKRAKEAFQNSTSD